MRKLLLLLFTLVTLYGRGQTLRAIPDTFSVLQANTDTFYVTHNDSISLGDSVCLTLLDTGTRFSVLNCHAVIYHPDSLFTGRDTFRYVLCDTLGICDTAIVAIYVDTNRGLLPMASFKDDSLDSPYGLLLFVCMGFHAPYGIATYQLSSTSQNADSLSWRIRTSGSLGSSLTFDSISYFDGDTITFAPNGLPHNATPPRLVFHVEVCLTAHNQYGTEIHCDTSCYLQYEGITEIPLSNIKIYPSPADNVLTIDMSKNNNPISSNYAAIMAYNLFGQKVRTIQRHNSNKVIEISVTDLADGIYLSTITDSTGKEMFLGKFVVAK